MKHIIALLLCLNIALAQNTTPASNTESGGQAIKPYDIPFASKGNVIELSMVNNSTITANEVKVEVTGIPECIKFAEKSVTIKNIKAGEEQTASFTFSVDKTAKVNKEQILIISITDQTGQMWKKEIKINIAPPMTYELCQNYPNPFNPTTTIEYQLPGTGRQFNVALIIYDLIGREVITLVNEQQEPGCYQKTFNASNLASGMYVYQLIAIDQHNNKHTFQKKMMLLK